MMTLKFEMINLSKCQRKQNDGEVRKGNIHAIFSQMKCSNSLVFNSLIKKKQSIARYIL